MAKRNPFSDDFDVTTDPSALFTGGGSQMFSNERLESRKTATVAGEQSRQASELAPIGNDLIKKIQQEIESVRSVESFMLEKIEDPQQLLDEIRARKLYISYLKGLEAWIRMRLKRQ